MGRDERTAGIAERTVVYGVPGMDDVEVLQDIEFEADGGDALKMDIYLPHGSGEGARAPAVVIVAGFPDAGFEAKVGRRFKEMGSSVSWGRLLAASGVAAVAYANREPAKDVRALLRHLRRNADALGLDADSLGLWASSGNVPLALSVLMSDGGARLMSEGGGRLMGGEGARLKCAVLFYGYTLDAGGAHVVEDAARTWGFANPCAGRSAEDLPARTPLFVARAGRDEMPGLNEALDRFAAEALALNLPVTLVNHAEGAHAFDLFDETEAAREVIRQALAFVRFNLSAGRGA
ncbi:MAG TPA: alpha/beta hydrolase [Pyrinomonadaceae bacterium]|nr:alpha/beta hydrolase [Pyrinomonadaceae bacterium]